MYTLQFGQFGDEDLTWPDKSTVDKEEPLSTGTPIGSSY